MLLEASRRVCFGRKLSSRSFFPFSCRKSEVGFHSQPFAAARGPSRGGAVARFFDIMLRLVTVQTLASRMVYSRCFMNVCGVWCFMMPGHAEVYILMEKKEDVERSACKSAEGLGQQVAQ